MRVIPIMVLASWLSVVPLFAEEATSPPCLMQPVARSIALPDTGFNWLSGGDFSGTCEDVPSDGWSRETLGAHDLWVHIDGPEGSGRFWEVLVGVSEKQHSKPLRGTCISTSTVGWRTLQRHSQGPLPWLVDVNHDGGPEFVLWDSFPLHDEATMAEYALVAWVYRLTSPDSLVVDWELSRGLARSVAKEYRSPLEATTEYQGELRAQAAAALERFADEECEVGKAR